MITNILNTLRNDAALQTLLQGSQNDSKIYAFSATKLNSIVYIYTDLSSNKITGQAKLELTVNTLLTDYALNMQITSRIKELLLTLADEQFNNDIIEILQNGGGSLRNDETGTIHCKLIFNIKYKERNK